MLSLIASLCLAPAAQGAVLGPVDATGRAVGSRSQPQIYNNGPGPRPAGRSKTKPDPAPYGSGSLDVDLEWRRWVMGSGIGYAGLKIADLDGDGVNEIVAASGPPSSFGANTFWYVLNRQADGSYEQSWTSGLYSANIVDLELADYNGDSRPDILIAVGNVIRVYSGPTKDEIATIPTSASQIIGLNYVDVDMDGQKEWVFVDSSALYVYSKTGTLEQKVTGLGGTDVAVGNVVPDRKLEIVVANDAARGYVLDGRNRAVIESYPQGIGYRLALIDFSGDNTDDIIGASGWYKISAFLVGISRTAVWQISTSHDIAAIWAGDVEGDGIPELVYGDGQWGSINVRDARNGSAKWGISNDEHGVTNIAVADLDGDSVKEVVFGAGYTSSGPDYLYVYDSVTRAREWRSTDFGGPFYGVAAGNADGDAAPELVYSSYDSESGYDDGLWFVHDAQTKALEFMSAPSTGSNWVGLWRIGMANVDADPQPEIFITSSSTYTGFLICYDSVTKAEQYRTSGTSGEVLHAMRIADVDSDGQVELICASSREHTGAPGTYVYVFNAQTGALEWQSPASIGSYWAKLDFLRVGNVDLDANMEIVVGEESGTLTVFDGVTHFGQVVTDSMDITALELANVNGVAGDEIVIGDSSGNLRVIDAYSGAVVSTLGSFGTRIDGLAIRDVAGNSAPDFIFCQNGSLRIVYRDASNIIQSWISAPIAPNAGRSDSLLVADVDNDGFQEVFMGDGIYGVRLYEIHP